jgi:inositol oxygenase
VDDSDPNTDLTQIEHLLQASEAIRTAVSLGGTAMGRGGRHFPGGLRFLERHRVSGVLHPDIDNPLYQTKNEVYEPNCGLDKLHMSFGHDGYTGEVVKITCPKNLCTCCGITPSIRRTDTAPTAT